MSAVLLPMASNATMVLRGSARMPRVITAQVSPYPPIAHIQYPSSRGAATSLSNVLLCDVPCSSSSSLGWSAGSANAAPCQVPCPSTAGVSGDVAISTYRTNRTTVATIVPGTTFVNSPTQSYSAEPTVQLEPYRPRGLKMRTIGNCTNGTAAMKSAELERPKPHIDCVGCANSTGPRVYNTAYNVQMDPINQQNYTLDRQWLQHLRGLKLANVHDANGFTGSWKPEVWLPGWVQGGTFLGDIYNISTQFISDEAWKHNGWLTQVNNQSSYDMVLYPPARPPLYEQPSPYQPAYLNGDSAYVSEYDPYYGSLQASTKNAELYPKTYQSVLYPDGHEASQNYTTVVRNMTAFRNITVPVAQRQDVQSNGSGNMTAVLNTAT